MQTKSSESVHVLVRVNRFKSCLLYSISSGLLVIPGVSTLPCLPLMLSLKTIILKYFLVCVFLVSPCCVHLDRRPDQTVSVVPSPRFVLFVFFKCFICSCVLSLAASESARREPSCSPFAGVYAAVRGSPIPRFAGVYAAICASPIPRFAGVYAAVRGSPIPPFAGVLAAVRGSPIPPFAGVLAAVRGSAIPPFAGVHAAVRGSTSPQFTGDDATIHG